MDQKKEIRKEVRRRIKELDEAGKQSTSKQIFDHIERLDAFVEARCVALFAAMGDEVPTQYALDRWPMLGKRVVVPRVEGDVMRFYDYNPEQMTTGAFGIEEPTSDTEIPAEALDLMIVPARAFTREGLRLGRGGGFYDKYMSLEGFRAYKIGIAYECQIFDSLPHAPHDIAVDVVITEA